LQAKWKVDGWVLLQVLALSSDLVRARMNVVLIMWQWKILYENSDPVTVYLDSSGTVVGYDFYDVTTRTGIVNCSFKIELGEIDKEVFDFLVKE
jgi:hypothetical protein